MGGGAAARPQPGHPVAYEAVIVGAGVVGLAVAARLAARWPGRVLVIERHDGICRETSSRNSEVIHAGIYYPTGSLKARSCVRGRALLVERCARLDIAAPLCGKVIVASDPSQIAALQELLIRGRANGVDGLRLVGRGELEKLEPGTAGVAALWSPASGIVDSHALAASFEAEATQYGADVVFDAELVGVDVHAAGYRLRVAQHGERFDVECGRVVNAAGLGQNAVSALAGIDVDAAGYRQHPCRGGWFSIAPRHRGRVRRLVYPVGSASDPGLGIHGCLDVGGGMRLGPDFEFVQRRADGSFDLDLPEDRRPLFFSAGARLFPWLKMEDLTPDGAGLRAKLVPRPGMWRDFVLAEESDRGLPGWVTLAGIESPGLTAAAALAEDVDEALLD